MQLVDIGNGHQLNEKAAPAFLAMNAAIVAELGIPLHVNVSTRTETRQGELYAAYVVALKKWENEGSDPAKCPAPVAKPGLSEHDEKNANAVDVNQASDARILPWLCKNGPRFGFYATASHEKWHWAWYDGRPPLTRYIRHLANLKSWR